jgi:hypothetical protein
LLAGLLALLARRVALTALLRLGLVVLIGHLNLLKKAMKHNLNVHHSNHPTAHNAEKQEDKARRTRTGRFAEERTNIDAIEDTAPRSPGRFHVTAHAI